jgi:predicted DNA-binding antitoxin AbrB/MazE fold protein
MVMTTVRAVYQGGVLRPAHPLPLAEGETVEVTITKPNPPSPDEWEREIRAAKTIQEWVALANACPTDTGAEFDIGKAISETRQLTGFRSPDPDSTKGGSA